MHKVKIVQQLSLLPADERLARMISVRINKSKQCNASSLLYGKGALNFRL